MPLGVERTRHGTGTGTTPLVKSGLAFAPQALIAIGSYNLAENVFSVGVAGGGAQLCLNAHDESGTPNSVNETELRNDCIMASREGSVNRGRLAWTNMTADGYTLTPTTAFAFGSPVAVLALGGMATTPKVTTFNLNTILGQQLVDFVFPEPDGAIFLVGKPGAVINTPASAYQVGIGWWSRHGGQGCIALRSRSGVTPGETRMLVRDDACLSIINATTDAENLRVVCNGATGNGLDLDIQANIGSNPVLVGVLLLKGAYVYAGLSGMRLDTLDQPFLSGGHPIKALMALLACAPTLGVIQNGLIASVGMGVSATNRGAHAIRSGNGVSVNSDALESTTRIALEIDQTPSAIADMNLKSLSGTDGGVLDQVIAATTAWHLPFLGFGDAIASNPTQLAIAAPAPGATVSGKPFTIAVRLKDAGGLNVPQAGVSVTIAKDSGSGTLSAAGTGLTVLTDPSGIATFDVEIAAGAGSGDHVLIFNSGVLAPVSSAVIKIASVLAITTQPSSTAASDAAFAQQPVVRWRDAAGTNINLAGETVRAALSSGGGALGGTSDQVSDASGIVTYADLKIVWTVGSNTHKLTFGDVGGNVTSAQTTDIVVSGSGGAAAAAPFGEGVHFHD